MRGDVLHRAPCVSGGTVLQLALDGLATSGVYALVGLGVQIAYAGSRVLHLGLGEAGGWAGGWGGGGAWRGGGGGAAAGGWVGVGAGGVRVLGFGGAGVLAGLACVLAAGRVAATPAAGVAIGLKGLCAAAAGGF